MITKDELEMTPIGHPGRFLKREPAARGLTTESLAWALSLGTPAIDAVLAGSKPITPGFALRLGRYFGNEPRFWLNLQSQHDLALAERDVGDEILRCVQPIGSE